ncbi:glycosyltransferase [Bacillus sp. Marseille-P3800]|uniref:glycosyltransferase n=1 Tax=Bacillus sp. Marseille-P3800 TaxID=2014782 RepID=UPI000C08A88E|nr:glycosyltransferase [Bacillus sp. Marseille-P3800]
MYTLLIHHNGGGGVSQFLKTRKHTFTIECMPLARGYWLLFQAKKERYLTMKAIVQRLRRLPIQHIEVHHVWGFRINEIQSLLEELSVPYDVFLHDYYGVCPAVFFINDHNRYCGMEKDPLVCQRCLENQHKSKRLLTFGPPPHTVEAWRTSFNLLFQCASMIIAPSESTKQAYLTYFPALSIAVQPHPLPSIKKSVHKQSIRRKQTLHVAVLGSIYQHKGESVLLELLNRMEQATASLPLSIYSYGSLAPALSEKRMIHERGTYEIDNLADLLVGDAIDLICIPSIVPETFSYTTHEAMLLGYPVLAFNLGAQAEAIKTNRAGWLVESTTGEALYKKLKELCEAKQKELESELT